MAQELERTRIVCHGAGRHNTGSPHPLQFSSPLETPVGGFARHRNAAVGLAYLFGTGETTMLHLAGAKNNEDVASGIDM